MEDGTVRINKALADAGVCSRRKADELIAAGIIRVNGEPILSPGIRVNPEKDTIEVDGKRLRAAPQTFCYLLLHKPVQVLSTVRDPEGRSTVLDFVPPAWKHRRLYPVGRLDFFSEGLLLLTDDGYFANGLTHPRHHLSKVYQVLVRETVSPDVLDTMRAGMRLQEGEQLAPIEVQSLPTSKFISGVGKNNTLLEMTLHQGINRQIRRMCRDLGLTILRLIRVAEGPLFLGEVQAGAVRPLTKAEVSALKKTAGLV